MTTPYAEVIGDPIAHSKSPLIHKFWLEKLGIEGDYRKAHVLAEDLADYLIARRTDPEWQGCNVTIPHKQAVMPILDRLDGSAEAVGAVNTIVRGEHGSIGYNTDVEGVFAAIGDQLSFRSRVCLIGGGGAALAAVALLRRHNVNWINFVVRDEARVRGLIDRLGGGAEAWTFEDFPDALVGCDIVINASPLGMAGKPPLPAQCLSLRFAAPDATVFDMVYDPLETELLRAAREQGFRAVDGLVMLIGQAASAFELFFGQPAPREHDAELRALLAA